MSDENRDSTTGQFSSAEPLYGLQGTEQDAGYVHLPDEEKTEEPEALTVAEAADQYTNSRTAEADIKTYGPVDLPENLAVTVEQAAKIHADRREADEAQAELEAADKLREEVDELRGVKPEADKAKPDAEATEDEHPVQDGELDPEIEKAFNNPKIRDAIAAHVTETETARQNHMAGLNAATQIAQAAFMSQFPEFANIPEAHRGQALMAMQQHDPARFAQIANAVQQSADLFRQQAMAQQQQQQAEQTRRETHSRTQSKIFEEKIKDVPQARRSNIEKEIATALSERGADLNEVVTFLRTSEASSASVMGLLWELGDTRLQLKAIKSAKAAVASKQLPPVQRPGYSRSSAERSGEDLSSLNDKLSKSGHIDDAFKLYKAKQGKRR